MKRLFIALGLTAALILSSCKENASSKVNTENVEVAAERDMQAKNLPVMNFEKTEHDFGTITQGTPQETVFNFTNTGNAPLIITNATSSCGCTVPKFSKEPIMPGDSGTIEVKYDTSRIGGFSKTITIYSNANQKLKRIRIKGIVMRPETNTTAKVNTAS